MIKKVKNIDGLKEGRLSFRKLVESDIELITPYFADKDSLKYRVPTTQTPIEMAEEWYNAIQLRYKNNWDGLYINELSHNREIVGLIGILRQTLDDEQLFEIGYHVLPQFRKNNIASEAAQILANQIEKNRIDTKVISIIHFKNDISKKVAKNNGMSLWKKTFFRKTPVEVWRKIF